VARLALDPAVEVSCWRRPALGVVRSMTEKDFAAEARTLERLGLSGIDGPQIRHVMDDGFIYGGSKFDRALAPSDCLAGIFKETDLCVYTICTPMSAANRISVTSVRSTWIDLRPCSPGNLADINIAVRIDR
jgi:hypothetical protein